MGDHLSDSAEQHLLSTEDVDPATDPGRTASARVIVKWVLDVAIGVTFVAWIAFLFLLPVEAANEVFEDWVGGDTMNTSIWAAHIFLVFGGPLLVITLLAVARFIILDSPVDDLLRKSESRKYPRVRLRTFPVLVDGPFGIVSAAEFIGICLFVGYVLWAMTSYTLQNVTELSEMALPDFKAKSAEMIELTGLRLAHVGAYCLAFLFLPVSRGSILLRLIDVPFEQAVRYHMWLGHLTMLILTLHGFSYIVAYAMQGILLSEITSWSGSDIAILPGAILLLVCLLMWVTSLPPVRKKQFELFFYTHHLYIVFVVFLVFHVGDYLFGMDAAGIFLFMIDRFLRFCQSRRTVQVISAKCLPCGAIELVLSKPPNLRYNALSFIFLHIRELSWLQWHPFSVSSSPLDGENHLSVLIKVLGGWTEKLNRIIPETSESRCQDGIVIQPCSITASVEGPYGHELPYHLTYENLVLVAGGIGISPFLAILSDILHRVREGKPCLPSNVLLVWAIKNSNELPLLSFGDTESLVPSSSSKLDLNINIYVTRESEPPLEEGNIEKADCSQVSPISCGHGMSVLVASGNNIWSGLYVISCIVGFVVLIPLVDIFYINSFDITIRWYKGLLILVCMLASVLIFGGFVVLLWYYWEQRTATTGKSEHSNEDLQSTAPTDSGVPRGKLIGSKSVVYGSRPNLKEIFGSVSDQWGHVDIGVIVCGPATLETSVAKECRSRNLKRGSDSPIFHFNSHTFEL